MHHIQSLFGLTALVLPATAQFAIQPSYGNTFQVHSQFSSKGATSTCGSIQEIQYSFANSYGTPAVATINPPSCGTDFTSVTFTLQNVAKGRQYDRLMILSLGSGEVWRSSTFEPASTGTYSTYTKDVTFYTALLKVAQTGILEIDNVIDTSSGIVGIFNVTLAATYYYGGAVASAPPDQNFALGTSEGSAKQLSIFKLSNGAWGNTTITQIPQNGYKATVRVLASGGTFGGGNTDEFWWANSNPFREVQLYIDNVFAGAYWPQPIIYTRGVDPSFWRPIVGINTYDEYAAEIDVTPFLGTISDYNAHTFSLRVANSGDGWFVSGFFNLWQNSSISQTVGSGYTSNALPNAVVGIDGLTASRSYTIPATINGKPHSWSQDLQFSNSQGDAISQITIGTDTINSVANKYSWPIIYNGVASEGITQHTLTHGFALQSLGLNTTSTSRSVSGGLVGYSTTTQSYTDGTGYSRTVTARSGTVTSDSNPSKRRHGIKREPSKISDFLDNLLTGPLLSFLEGELEISLNNLKRIAASIEVLGGFDVTKVPKQVIFAPPTKLSQGARFYVGP